MVKVDYSKLKKAPEVMSFEEATKDIFPLELPKEVLTGDKNISVVSVERMDEGGYVKLEIV